MEEQLTFEFDTRKPIKGYPELHWTGKRPYTSTQYYPAQLKESYGEAKDGWMNKIFWGDNLQVMSHLLKEYRGKVNLIYIDPPFDSKADYKKKIQVKKDTIYNDNNVFEEKQYTDIWLNDEYLQYMYERIVILRELLADTGTLYLHCDYHKVHFLKCIMDEVFGSEQFHNEIIWTYNGGALPPKDFPRKHDNILRYTKGNNTWTFNTEYRPYNELTAQRMQHIHKGVKVDVERGTPITDWWTDIKVPTGPMNKEKIGYPTQKPEALLERIIKVSSNPGDLVLDCFMGSGTTQAVAMKLGRRFIGADINLGAIQTTTKRLINAAKDLAEDKYTGFEVYNVNNYDFFRNPLEAKELIVEALGIQKYDSSVVYDGELDGYMVKIMPTNRIATKADLEELKANLPYATFEKRKEENPDGIVERIKIICIGHEPDLKASLEQELSAYKIEIEILDILKDKSQLQFKRESDALVVKEEGKLLVKEFYPMNLLQKLSMQKETVEDWRQLVESVFIDWNYDGETMRPSVTDIPGKDELVAGIYEIPKDATRIMVKITDLLSESLEVEV